MEVSEETPLQLVTIWLAEPLDVVEEARLVLRRVPVPFLIEDETAAAPRGFSQLTPASALSPRATAPNGEDTNAARDLALRALDGDDADAADDEEPGFLASMQLTASWYAKSKPWALTGKYRATRRPASVQFTHHRCCQYKDTACTKCRSQGAYVKTRRLHSLSDVVPLSKTQFEPPAFLGPPPGHIHTLAPRVLSPRSRDTH